MRDAYPVVPDRRPRSRAQASRACLIALLAGLLVITATNACLAAPDDNWSSAFGLPGLIGSSGIGSDVLAMVNWNGTLVVGGDIGYAAATRARHVVRWNGTGFEQMGAGLNGAVTSLAVVSGVLYAAGDFDSSGSTPLPHVARWTGTAWVAVGSLAPDNPNGLRLAADGTTLLLLGGFTTIDSPPVAATAIAAWNGASWSDVGGFSAAEFVNTAMRFGGTLFAGSDGDGAGGGTFHSFNGTSWTTSNRIVDSIRGMTVFGSTLYVLGDFSEVDFGSVPADQIVSWDGANFADLAGVSFNGGTVQHIGIDNGQLLAVGGFDGPGSRAAYWDGASWSSGPCGSGTNMDGGVRAFARVGTEIALGGNMTRFFNSGTGRFEAVWGVLGHNGTACKAVQPGGGVSAGGLGAGGVLSLSVYGSRLIAGGDLNRIGEIGEARGIAAWNGIQWATLGGGLAQTSGSPSADELGSWGGRLVVTGYLTGAGSVSSLNIISWDGTNWLGFDGGFTCQGANVVDYNGELIAAGTNGFGLGTAIGTGQPLGHVARWTGTQWQTIGTVTPTSGVEGDAVVWNGSLVYGGTIATINGVPVNNIAQWNGTGWNAIGNGFNGFVTALAVWGGELYASGNFTQSGATALPGRIARWNGSAWMPVGSGLDNAAFALTAGAARLYATGNFTTAGGSPAAGIAAWDGSSWSRLGSGLGKAVLGNNLGGLCVQTWGDSLFVGGYFNTAGDRYSSSIARWFESTTTDVSPVPMPRGRRLTAAPNPVVSEVALTFELAQAGRVEIAIYDVSGRRVRALSNGALRAGRQVLRWDRLDDAGHRVAAGVYQARVIAPAFHENVRVALVQ